MADFFEAVARAADPKAAANWVSNEVLRVLGDDAVTVDDLLFRPADLALLIGLVSEGRLYMSPTTLGDRYALRACIVSFRTRIEDIDFLVDQVVRTGNDIVAGLNA